MAENEDFEIYALKGSSDWFDILSSLKQGEGRFGWSYVSTADLRELKQRVDLSGWDSLSEEEKDCYQSFLLNFKKGDYVVYINIPEWGKCTAAQITGEYYWKYDGDDFNHRFPVDPERIYVFDRNDAAVHPALGARLKLQSRWWRIYLQKEFLELMSILEKGMPASTRTLDANLRLLSNEIQPFLSDITKRIHHTHPNTDLEGLISEVFKEVPNVVDVKWQGGSGDHGADILVTYEKGLPIPGLEKQSTLVVQVKSYEGEHWDTKAVDDISRAFKQYPDAEMGLIISTGNSLTATVEEAIDKLREETNKPIACLIGSDVAAFLLRYGAKLLA